MSTTPRIFILGAAGYLGGTVAVRMIEKHPEWEIVALVRNQVQKEIILSRWPKIGTVIGTLDDREVLVREASKADVVLQIASADHVPGALALVEGASLRKPNPGRVVHVSGTGMLHDVPNGFGQPSSKIYSDTTSLPELTSLPVDGHIHRDVEAAILSAQHNLNVPTVIVSPPLIHGIGRGPGKKGSIQIPLLVGAIFKRGRGFMVGEGANIWDAVHVDDVADALVLLAEEGIKPDGGKAQWGDEGYYFVEAEEFKWGDIAATISKALYEQGAIKSGDVDSISVEDATQQHPWASVLWGGNCRSRADRIRNIGWEAKGQSVLESVPEMVVRELKNI